MKSYKIETGYTQEYRDRVNGIMDTVIAELPEITEGSEKQIAWAQDIRALFVKIWAIEKDRNFGPYEDEKDLMEKAGQKIFAITDAKWWIDTRNSSVALMAQKVLN